MNAKDCTANAAIEILDRLAKFLAAPNQRGMLKQAKLAIQEAQSFPRASERASAIVAQAIRNARTNDINI